MRGSFSSFTCKAAACLLLVLPLCLQAATFHAILVADTEDPRIGKSAATDLNRARLFAESIAEYYGTGNIVVVSGTAAKPQRVLSAIDSLEVGLDDFVFFFYTGHGNTGRPGSPWPVLGFGGDSIEGVDILNRISSRTPLRVLAVFDACNGEIRMPPMRAPASVGFHPSQIDRLFRQMRGSVIVASSEAPYVSYADEFGRGSRFSTALFLTLESALASPGTPSSWTDLLSRARDETFGMIPEQPQRPTFLIRN